MNRYTFTPYSDDGLTVEGPGLSDEIRAFEGGIRLEIGPLVAVLHWRDGDEALGGCPWTWEIVWPESDNDSRARKMPDWKVSLEWSGEPGPALVVETPEPVTVTHSILSDWREERKRLADNAYREAEKVRLDREVAKLQTQRAKHRWAAEHPELMNPKENP